MGRMPVLLGCLLLTLAAHLPASGAQKADTEAEARALLRPERRFDHRKLMPAGDQERSPVERARTAVACLREEIRLPSEGVVSPIVTRHQWVLNWMLVGYLGHQRVRQGLDLKTVQDASHAAVPGEERDVIVILRGILGDRGVLEYLHAYLSDASRPPYLRIAAIHALSILRDPRSIELLLQVMERDLNWHRRSRETRSRTVFVKSFIVRDEARRALVAFEQAGLLKPEHLARKKAAATSEEFPALPLGEVPPLGGR